MSALSDTITLGLVLILLFGSACLYLYTRIQQNEAKINLLEGILLDLKMSNELKAYPNVGYPVVGEMIGSMFVDSHTHPESTSDEKIEIKPFMDEDNHESANAQNNSDLEFGSNEKQSNGEEHDEHDEAIGIKDSGLYSGSIKITPNYEAMTLLELKALGKQRNSHGISSMSRAKAIQALKSADNSNLKSLDSLTEVTEDSIESAPNAELA
jgi:hypothetical protein